ncbi:MAG: hypothetical protein ABI520_04525 [Caldimonas sp.]
MASPFIERTSASKLRLLPIAAHVKREMSLATTLRAALVYFALVLGAGFILGVIRVPIIVPRIGERWAELAEMPFMAAVIFFSAGFVVRKFPAIRRHGRAWFVGFAALVLAVVAELGLAVALQSQTLGEYLATRDRISGSVYLAMLIVFALMPGLRVPRHEPGKREA